MKPKDAVSLLDQVVGQYMTTREEHKRLGEAIEVLRDFVETEPPEPEGDEAMTRANIMEQVDG